MSKQHKPLREKFNLRAKPGQVIPYSQADHELRGRMDKVMEPVSKAPHSFEELIGYGHRSLEKLGRAANRMVKVQEQFNAVSERVNKAVDALTAMPTEPAAAATGEAVQTHLEELAMGAKTTLSEEAAQKAIADLHKMLAQRAEQTLPVMLEAEKELRRLQHEARRADRQRRDAAREIGIHLGAGEQLSKKFEGHFLKHAVRKLHKNWSDDNKHHLKAVLHRTDDFKDRVTVLESSRSASFVAREQMKEIRKTIQEQRQNVKAFVKEYEKTWKPLLNGPKP